MKSNALVLLCLLILGATLASAATLNGFDLSDSLIAKDKIGRGGPPRDGIPSIDDPKFVPAADADFLTGKDRVIGLTHGGAARAYPIKILNWHEIVNDRVADLPIVVSFCPLCNTGMVFRAPGDGEFGVSGLLYNSDVLLYDRDTESLWSQMMGKAIAGPRRGQELAQMAASHTTWRDWHKRHPETLVLSTKTGFRRDYDRSPYLDYARSPRLFFDVEYRNRAHGNKELVLGVSLDGQHKAFPFSVLEDQGKARFQDEFADQTLTVSWSQKENTAAVFDQDGVEIPSLIAYWFAWYAFHPDTEVLE